MIAAGSVVVKDVKAGTIVGGIPNKLIKHITLIDLLNLFYNYSEKPSKVLETPIHAF